MADGPAGGATILDRRKSVIGVATETADHGTKTDFLKNAKPGKIPAFPGDFELQKLTLTSPNKKGYIDLKAAWSDFNIYEDLFGNYLTGNIQIVDGVGLMEAVPIIGEETIHIQVKTKGIVRQRTEEVATGPFAGSENEGIINLKFRVVKISDIMRLNEGILTYKLSFVSEEAILNLKQKVRKSSLDPSSLEPRKISDVVKSLYTQFFKRGRTAKKVFVEPTKNITDLIIPNQSPFKAFNFLASRAVSAGKQAVGSNFVFYESVRGFFFISMETLFTGGGMGYNKAEGDNGSDTSTELVYTIPKDPVKETYVVQPKRLSAQKNENVNVAVEMTAVEQYSFSSNFDVLDNLSQGMYANRLLTHDLVRMKYDTLDFNLQKPSGKQTKINEATGGTEVIEMLTQAADKKNFEDVFTHLGQGKLATEKQDALGSPDAVISFYPTNFAHDVRFKEDLGSQGVKGGMKSNLNIIPNRVEQWMQSRLVQSQQVNNIKLNIRAPGLSTRSVGDLIEFKLPTSYLEDRDGVTQSQHHTYLSGYYLITKLRHHFNKEKYEIEFEAIKDSLKVPPGKDRSVSEADDTTTVNTPQGS